MATDYGRLYAETPNPLSEPTPQILKFFQEYQPTTASFLDRLDQAIWEIDVQKKGFLFANKKTI